MWRNIKYETENDVESFRPLYRAPNIFDLEAFYTVEGPCPLSSRRLVNVNANDMR